MGTYDVLVTHAADVLLASGAHIEVWNTRKKKVSKDIFKLKTRPSIRNMEGSSINAIGDTEWLASCLLHMRGHCTYLRS